MRCLLVERDPDYGDLISALLGSRGHDILAVTSGAEALDALEREDVALAVIDSSLPDTTADALCAAMRAREPDLPIIFLTDVQRVSATIAGLQAGADDCISKPFHPRELAARVDSVMRRAHKRLPAGTASDP